MRHLFPVVALALALSSTVATAQLDTRLLRFPAIHNDQIVFSYAGDLYTVATTGGTAPQDDQRRGVRTLPALFP